MVILVSGWAMERFGAKQMWMFSLALFLASSVLSSLALHGLRLLARRPRRGLLNALTIAVTVTGIVARSWPATPSTPAAMPTGQPEDRPPQRADGDHHGHAGHPGRRQHNLHRLGDRGRRQAVIGAGARVRRAPRQVSAGLSAAQLLPALPGTIVGIPAGIYLYRAVTHDQLTVPRPGSYSPAGTLLVVTGLTAIPASAPAAPSRDPASRVITGAANRRRDSPLICRDTDGDSGGRKSRPIDRSGTLT